MEKIVFIGKFNLVFQGMNKHLAQNYDVQVCVDNYNMVKSMLETKRPDLIIVSLIELDVKDLGIFGELKNNYSGTPVLCNGTEKEQQCFTENFELANFKVLTRPVSNDKLLEIVDKLLKCGVDCGKTDGVSMTRAGAEEVGRKRILLIDDNAIQLRTLNGMLKHMYDVQMVTSGMKALALIEKNLPDIIFLDYEMPECDGKMTLEMIRKVEEAKDIPVVFLTGVRDKEHIEAVLKLKPAGYLLKPASADMIYDILNKILKTK